MKLLHLVHVCLGYLIGWENPQIITDYDDNDYGHGHGQGFGYGSRSRYYGYSGHRFSPFLEEPVLPPPPPPPPYILIHNKPIIPQRIFTALPNQHQHPPTPKSIILTTLLPPPPMSMQSAINQNQHTVLTNKPFFTKLTPSNKNIINVGKGAFCDLKCTIPLKLELTCGTNGVTYYNRDELRCAKRLCFPDLKLAYTGKCVDNTNSNNNAAGGLRDEIDIDGDGVTGKENIELVNNSNNFLDKGMLTDGPVTFGRIEDTTLTDNSHDIDIDIKSLNNRGMSRGISRAVFSGSGTGTGSASVKTKNKVETNGGETIDGIGQNRISEKELDCDVDQCSCSFNLLQVCGTDGKTYGNACFLNCMQACDPDLRKYHNGACRVISNSLGVGGEGVIVPRARARK